MKKTVQMQQDTKLLTPPPPPPPDMDSRRGGFRLIGSHLIPILFWVVVHKSAAECVVRQREWKTWVSCATGVHVHIMHITVSWLWRNVGVDRWEKVGAKETHVHVHRQAHAYARARTHTHVCTYMDVHVHTHTHAFTHTHTHMYAYMDVHTHTHTEILGENEEERQVIKKQDWQAWLEVSPACTPSLQVAKLHCKLATNVDKGQGLKIQRSKPQDPKVKASRYKGQGLKMPNYKVNLKTM